MAGAASSFPPGEKDTGAGAAAAKSRGTWRAEPGTAEPAARSATARELTPRRSGEPPPLLLPVGPRGREASERATASSPFLLLLPLLAEPAT